MLSQLNNRLYADENIKNLFSSVFFIHNDDLGVDGNIVYEDE